MRGLLVNTGPPSPTFLQSDFEAKIPVIGSIMFYGLIVHWLHLAEQSLNMTRS